MDEIIWPAQYRPGEADNFSSNEVIVKGLTVENIWPYLNNTNEWPHYYKNASDIVFHDGSGPFLSKGARFKFTTFGFHVEAEVTEYVPPQGNTPARVAWHGWVEGGPSERLDVHHAWLLQNLTDDRVRVLTQETQNGAPAKQLAATHPNPMINAHQDWLDGLIRSALKSQ